MTAEPPSVEEILMFACNAAGITRATAESELGRSDQFYLPPKMRHEPETVPQAARVTFMHGTPDEHGFEGIWSSRDKFAAPVAVQFNLRPFFDDPEPVWPHALPLDLSPDARLPDLTARFGQPTLTGLGECMDWWGCESVAWRFDAFLWLTVHTHDHRMAVMEYGEPMGLIIEGAGDESKG